jgi:thioredoxin-like negative regulator of GroEL
MPSKFSKEIKSEIKRAAIIAALFLFCGHDVFAQKGNNNRAAAQSAETFKDLIDKAYNLSLQQDRSQAISILVNGIKKESKKGQVPKELLQTLEEVSSIFYSDKAQQLFETGISLKTSDPQTAASKLNEALRSEPENLAVQSELIRLQLYSSDCAGAQKQIKKIQEANPYNEALKLHLGQTFICMGSFELFDQLYVLEGKKSQYQCFWGVAEAEKLFKKAEYTKAYEKLKNLETYCKQFPERSYWLWKIESELKYNNETTGQNYVSACKKLSIKQSREFAMDPNLCRRLVEVESVIKKPHN